MKEIKGFKKLGFVLTVVTTLAFAGLVFTASAFAADPALSQDGLYQVLAKGGNDAITGSVEYVPNESGTGGTIYIKDANGDTQQSYSVDSTFIGIIADPNNPGGFIFAFNDQNWIVGLDSSGNLTYSQTITSSGGVTIGASGTVTSEAPTGSYGGGSQVVPDKEAPSDAGPGSPVG